MVTKWVMDWSTILLWPDDSDSVYHPSGPGEQSIATNHYCIVISEISKEGPQRQQGWIRHLGTDM